LLKSRVITAVVLSCVFVTVLVFGSWQAFAILVGIAFSAAAWEWSNLSGISRHSLRIGYAFITTGLGISVFMWIHETDTSSSLKYFLLMASTWWAVALLWVQGYPSSAILWKSSAVRALMGWLVLIPAWVALVFLRRMDHGAWIVSLIVVIVAAADVGAYFSGKRFGKRKLASNVSPGKSWEGVWGGMLMSLLLGSVMIYANSSFTFGAWILALILPTAMVSVVGDLLESMLKRHRGIKDSSSLLPGHGGVLDRIDGLVAGIPIFTLVFLAANGGI